MRALGPGLGGLLTLLTGACVADFDYEGTRFRCELEPVCPRGYTCASGTCVPEGGLPPDAGGGEAFRFRRALSFDNAGREALSDVPVLVVLDESRIDYSRMQPAGQDLEFRDADGTALPHEIESWDAAGTSYVWVRVPEIAADATDDSIWMYYGDPDAADRQQPEEVWAGYQAVYHLDGSLEDSSAQALHGTDSGTAPATGPIGPARTFDGAGDYVDLGTDQPFAVAAPAVTISAWLRPGAGWSDRTSSGMAFATSVQAGAPTTRSRAQLELTPALHLSATARSGDDDAGTEPVADGVTLAEEAWAWAAVVIDFAEGSMTFYLDGAPAGDFADLGLGPSTPDSLSSSSSIGSEDDGSQQFFLGEIDEVRLALQARSAAWMAAQHASMTGELLTFGAEEEL